jgi:butyryl-CoA dehydrogenase
MQALADQQEVMGALADCIMEVYAMESCLLRAEKLGNNPQAIAITQFYLSKAIERVELAARKIIAAVADGDMLRTQMAILRRLAKHDPVNTLALSRRIAGHVIA